MMYSKETIGYLKNAKIKIALKKSKTSSKFSQKIKTVPWQFLHNFNTKKLIILIQNPRTVYHGV